MNPTIEQITLDRIRPSKTNPRKHFDEAYIAELSDSIRQRGIIVPLLARPDWCIGKSADEISAVNGNAPASAFFEIIAGECRYRGAMNVPLESAPVIVQAVSDQETLELQLIENLQRADLDAFEEAEGYHRLLEIRDADGKAVHSVETIALRLNKPRQRIYYRLKLLRAPVSVRKAVLDKTLSVEIAEQIGGIPMSDLREQAAAEILKPEHEPGPLTVRRAREVIAEKYVKSLVGAPFDLKDATLVAVLQDEQTGERIGGGDCETCPMRTGNMEAIIGKTKRPDVCTNPGCYRLKCDAQFARLQATAESEGKRLLTEAEAADTFEEDGSLWFDSPYVKLADKLDINDATNPPEKLPTWKKLLEDAASKPQIIIGRDPKGRIVELVDRSLAMEAVKLAAKQRGESSIFDAPARRPSSSRSTSTSSESGEEPEWKKQDRKNREIAKVNFEITLAGMGALIGAIEKKGAVKGFWDALIEASITHAGHDGCWLICKRLGLDPKAQNKHTTAKDVQGAALEYGLSIDSENEKLAFIVELLISQRVKIYNSGSLGGIKAVDCFKGFAALYKVDLATVEKDVRAKLKEKTSPPAKAAKVKKEKGQSDVKASPLGTIEHQWDRKSGEKLDGAEATTRFKCKRCEATGSQFGTTWPPVADKEFLERPCTPAAVDKKKLPKCSKCPNPADAGSLCTTCQKKNRDRQKARRAKARKGGAKK